MPDRYEEDAPLQTLWRRRDELDESEWAQLYHQVHRLLTAYSFTELQGSTTSLDDCIHDFFIRKVFLNRCLWGRLCGRYANSCRGAALLLPTLSGLTCTAPPTQEITSLSTRPESQVAEVAFRQFLDAADLEPVESLDAATLTRITTAARDFLESQESWVGLYLRHCLCASSPIPLLRFKDHLPSYHYKAQQLGLAPPAHGDYRRTLLGRWLRSLNLPTIFDDRDVAQAALKILCQQALLLVEDELPFTMWRIPRTRILRSEP